MRSFILIHLIVGLLPLLHASKPVDLAKSYNPDWPVEFQGEQLVRLPMSEKEKGFSKGFPGEVARFTDGEREFILRYVVNPTRKLHPSADCLKGSGYSVQPSPLKLDKAGNHWGCAAAERQNKRLRVCERIYDLKGNSWSDVSSWYWSAMMQKTTGPWWAVTVAERS